MKYQSIGIVIILLLAGCAPQETQQPITIGATLTLTGWGVQWADNARKGMDLAVQEVNAEGGINGTPLFIVYEDIGSLDLKAAASAAQKFTTRDNVSIIITQWAEDTQVVWPIATRANIITLVLSSGAKGMTNQSPLVFRVWPSADEYANVTVRYAVSQGAQNAGIISEQSAYFDGMTESNKEIWTQNTGREAYVERVRPNDNDFRSVLAKMKSKNIDVLFIQTGYGSEGLILKQMQEIDIKPTIVVGVHDSDDASVIASAGAAAEGIVFPALAAPSQEFSEKFFQQYGVMPKAPADTAYDTIKILANAMRNSGVSTEALQRELYAVNNYHGYSGIITIDENRGRQGTPALLKRIENGTGVIVPQD